MKYPIYIISKGRYENPITANSMVEDKVNFHLVVEPQEADKYIAKFGKDRVYILPFSNLGKGSIPARNWVWEHSRAAGFKRHWIVDDNIGGFSRFYDLKRIRCNADIALSAIEEFTDRYENIAISGPNYEMFAIPGSVAKPYYLNTHVYSCILILNDLPFRWRGRYNEDTDLCLQALSKGWCTVSTNVFLQRKMRTMTMKGGNSATLYKGIGRYLMAKELKDNWPGIVEIRYKYGRPQHYVKNHWKNFNTPLRRRKDIDWNNMKDINESGIKLVKRQDIKSPNMKRIYEAYAKKG